MSIVTPTRHDCSNPYFPDRLDVEHILSENLKLAFFKCNSEDRLPLLFHLLQNVINSREQSVIFVATSHHVEYLQSVSFLAFSFILFRERGGGGSKGARKREKYVTQTCPTLVEYITLNRPPG